MHNAIQVHIKAIKIFLNLNYFFYIVNKILIMLKLFFFLFYFFSPCPPQIHVVTTTTTTTGDEVKRSLSLTIHSPPVMGWRGRPPKPLNSYIYIVFNKFMTQVQWNKEKRTSWQSTWYARPLMCCNHVLLV